MHAREMAEFAGWLSFCSPLFSQGLIPPDFGNGMRYWAASKCRLQRWQSALKMFEEDVRNPDPRHNPWPAIEALVQEILVSELLTRVWTALLVQHDEISRNQELKCIGYSVYIGHLEARNRAARLILHDRARGEEVYERLNQMRCRLERWTDMLLSRLDDLNIARQFGFDRHRVSDFAADRHLEHAERRSQMESLLQASLAAALGRDTSRCTANPDLNREIVAGILECFPDDRFDGTGLPKGLLHLQVERTGEEAARMLDTLVGGNGLT